MSLTRIFHQLLLDRLTLPAEQLSQAVALCKNTILVQGDGMQTVASIHPILKSSLLGMSAVRPLGLLGKALQWLHRTLRP